MTQSLLTRPFGDWRARFKPRVAIVGGGFSGTMLAIHLLEQPDVDVTLIESVPEQLGRGVAYSADHDGHVLNVRASNMSAWHDRPDDFVDWLHSQSRFGPAAFVPRSVYGEYLRDCLSRAQKACPGRLTIVHDQVLDLAVARGSVSLGMASGQLIEADRVVLAVGNLPPHDPAGLQPDRLAKAVYWPNPWAPGSERGLTSDAPVLLLGSGLTAIDIVLRLTDTGFSGPIIAMSRRGLRPHAHVDGLLRPDPVLSRPADDLSHMVRWARNAAKVADWRSAVDSLRPITQLLWAAASPDVRGRFLRHLRPYWDIHRHRLAPSVAQRIDALVDSGQLRFVAGKLCSIGVSGDRAAVGWRARGAVVEEQLTVQRIYNCTGPQGDLLKASDPMLKRLVATGMIRPDRLRLGLDVDRQCRVIGRDGQPNELVRAVGPITRGDLWEVVAVPDIRVQVAKLASTLTQAHWVGGEGL